MARSSEVERGLMSRRSTWAMMGGRAILQWCGLHELTGRWWWFTQWSSQVPAASEFDATGIAPYILVSVGGSARPRACLMR
jgi:hypothetical protein